MTEQYQFPKIKVIRTARAFTGLDLAEAKGLVDDWVEAADRVGIHKTEDECYRLLGVATQKGAQGLLDRALGYLNRTTVVAPREVLMCLEYAQRRIAREVRERRD